VRKFLLIGVSTDIEWQLACEASKHAVSGSSIDLEHDTPEGDIQMTVTQNKQQTVIRRTK